MSAAVAVSVVVPTCNRRPFLDELVPLLRAQDHPAYEVIFVDDGSVDDTAAHLRAVAATDDRIRVVSTPNRGPAAARNTGVGEAEGEWIVFTDDDCLPQPGWLSALVRRAEATGASIVQGRTQPDERAVKARAEHPWFTRSLWLTGWSGRFQTCNLLIEAARFRAVGGFDEAFPMAVGEDTDLGIRLEDAGATTAYADDAVVHHRVLPMTYREFLRRRWFWGNVVQLVQRNPRARRVFPHPYVAYPSHVAFWGALAVSGWAVANRRWAVPAAGLAGYSAVRARRSRYKGRPLPVAMALGASELGGVAAGAAGFVAKSMKYRRLLL